MRGKLFFIEERINHETLVFWSDIEIVWLVTSKTEIFMR